jgi:hypothetical protein
MICFKKKLILSILCFLFLDNFLHSLAGHKFTVDKIIARINGVNILQHDLKQPRIEKEGNRYSIEDAAKEELFYQKAKEKHLLPSPSDVDRQIVAFKMQNNMVEMSDVEFENQLKDSGFSLIMYKKQLGRLLAIENFKRVECSEKIVVSSQEIEGFCKKNIEYSEEKYHLEIAKTKEKFEEKNEENIKWEDLGWFEKDEIGESYKFVLNMKRGQVSKPVSLNGEFRIVRLVDKKSRLLKSIGERYGDVERKIREQKKDQIIKSIEDTLMQKSSIIVF